MPLVTRRGLGSLGIQNDPNDYDLPSQAFSGGSNVWFDGNAACRAPVFRTVHSAASSANPDAVVGRRTSGGYDTLFMVNDDGVMNSWLSDVITVVTPVGLVPASGTAQWTSTFLGDVTYVNRSTHIPYGFYTGASVFTAMPSWDATWRCASLRAYKDYLIALNVTKAGVAYPQMVKTSNNTLVGQFPDSWDATDPSKNTTENILSGLTSPIIDGCPLGDAFMIYAKDQIWRMQAVTSSEVFQYRQLFTDGGAIAPNCVLERDGRHFVFGPDDIFSHDGNSKTSVVELKNRQAVFRAISRAKVRRCFVQDMPKFKSILFAYPTNDPTAAFPAVSGCNRGLVINLASGTETFVDLPDVTSATQGSVNSLLLWSTATASYWNATGGSWADQAEGFEVNVVFSTRSASGSTTTAKLVAYDFMDYGSLSRPFDTAYNMNAYLERTGIDLDDAGAPLNAYKAIRAVYPQIDMGRAVPIYVQLGASLTPRGTYTWDTVQTYDPTADYKIDTRVGGRYLGIRFMTSPTGTTLTAPTTAAATADFALGGFDLDVVDWGHR